MPENKTIWSVSQLNGYIKKWIASNQALNRIYVRGEISNFKAHFSGHLYLSLKDENATIRAVMFKGCAGRLRFRPENGMKIVALGQVAVFERDGQVQLYIEEMQPEGIGALQIAFEQLKQKLDAEGLFAAERKKPLPAYPKIIGVVTASTGAAIRDILQVLRRRYPIAKVTLYPVLVQGEQAPGEICQGIRYFNESFPVDVMIVGRGGGSIEDLWAFNDEQVARTIAASRIPVISAVGHEVDFTIADFVADLRAPTPSAAAELCVPDVTHLRSRLVERYRQMKQGVVQSIRVRSEALNRLAEKRVLRFPQELLTPHMLRLDAASKGLQSEAELAFEKQHSRFSNLCGKLDVLSPLQVLSRGYAIVTDAEDKPCRTVSAFSTGERLQVRMQDGRISCEVLEVFPDDTL